MKDAIANAGKQDSASFFGHVDASVRGNHCLIDVDNVAVPTPDSASVADPLELIFERESALFAGSNIVKPKSDWPAWLVLLSKRIYRGVKPGHYPRLIHRLLAANMIKLYPSSDEVIENSIFGVWKEAGVSQRLIWAGNRSNMLFNEELSSFELPSPDIVGSMFIDDDKHLHMAGCDISQYYNRLRAPPELITFLGMPKIKAETLGLFQFSGDVTPYLTCIPMGATFSVALAQAVSTAVLKRNLLPVPASFLSLLDAKIKPGRNVVIPYIDDINVIGTSPSKVNRDQRKAAGALATASLHVDARKSFLADDTRYKVAIGLAWCKEGALRVKPAHTLRIFESTNRIVCSKRASMDQVRHVIGLWTYALLLRRPAFSILFYTFRFLAETSASTAVRQRLPDSVIEELGALQDVFPLLVADLRQQLAPRIYFSDGCKTGAGVQYADLSPREAWLFKDNVAETRARKGWYSSLVASPTQDDDDFTFFSSSPSVTSRRLKVSKSFERAIKRLSSNTAVVHKWRYPGHINHLETKAQLLAVRHMASCPSTRGHRVISLVDNTSTLGAIAKGRSSSPAGLAERSHTSFSPQTSRSYLIGSPLHSTLPTNRHALSNMALRSVLLTELRTISPLRRASIASSTFRDYARQVWNLTVYVAALGFPTDTLHQLDVAVSAYGVHLYDDNPRRGNLQKFRYTLFGVIFFLPELKPLLNRARQTEKGWDKTVPSASPPPVSVTTVNAMSALLASVGRIRASLAINLGVHAFLRANEICSLRVADV